jgi:hypothetical protein
MSTQKNIDTHYNVEGFSEEERREIVMKYYAEHPAESDTFIAAKPHIKAQMIIKIMDDVEEGMKNNPAKWWRVRSNKTLLEGVTRET